MPASCVERRLAAILAADVVGYSSLMERDEDRTLTRLKAHRTELIEPLLAQHHGRLVKLMGDGALAEFTSVVHAVACAVAIQHGITEREKDIAQADRIWFRIGINLGDVVVEGDDIHGDGVNIAARLEGLSEPGGIAVSGTAYDHLQGKLDLPLDFLGEQRVKNIERPIRVYRVRLGVRLTTLPNTRLRRRMAMQVAVLGLVVALLAVAWWLWPQSGPAARKPTIAVLPFSNMTGQAADDFLADGVTDDLITDLAKLSGLAVIARNSVFGYKDRTVPLADIADGLGVRYAVQGSVRRSGGAMRINVQLVDATTGASLWAERYDRSSADVFSIEEEVVRTVAATLGVKLTPAEQAKLSRPPTESLEAYDYFLRARRAARSGYRPDLGQAFELYSRAIDLDPAFADAFAARAALAAYVWRYNYDSVLPGGVARKQAYESASRALALNPDLSLPYTVLSSLQLVGREYDEAIASAQKALALAPGEAAAYTSLGLALTFSGRYAEAVQAAEAALRLDPAPPISDAIAAGLAFTLGGQAERAIEVLERARAAASGVDEVFAALTLAYATAGRLDAAQQAAANASRLDPTLNVQLFKIIYAHLHDEESLDRILNAWRKAGLPEWPWSFQADGLERMDGSAIAQLAFGHTWQGETGEGAPALLQFGADGRTFFRTPTQLETGNAFIDHDLLCQQTDSVLMGRPRCGPVYRGPKLDGENGFGFTYVNGNSLFRFNRRA